MLKLNFTNCLADSIGIEHGLTEPEIFGLETRLKEASIAVMRQGNSGKIGFMDLPNNAEEARRISAWAQKTRGSFDTLVVLGIGGSALGPIAVQQALHPATWNLLDKKARRGWLRLFVYDNVDPRWALDLLNVLDLRKTLFNVISKSGDTVEPMATFLIVRDALMPLIRAA